MNKIVIEAALVVLALSAAIFLDLTIIEVAIWILNALLIWEIVRMAVSYVIDKAHAMDLRLLIDGFIVIFLRELLIVFTEHKDKYISAIMVILLIMILLFAARKSVFSDQEKYTNVSKEDINE